MKPRSFLVVLTTCFLSFLAPPSGAAEGVEVLVQADQACDSVSQWIQSVGGRVHYRYRNVQALAATVPSEHLATLGGLSGVTTVEKDRLLYLHDPAFQTRERARSFVAAAHTGHRVTGVRHDQVAALASAQGYANFLYTGAAQIWEQTGFGDGTIVAVVDSGVARNVALADAVIGAPGFPNGYNAYPDGAEATDVDNFWHGTLVAGVIAGAAALELSDPTDPLYAAIATHLPWLAPETAGDPILVPLLGQAPFAKIYPVKVFPQVEGGTPTSIILDGLDHVLTLKKSGALDVDIVNMSLGGPTVWDGLNTFDLFLTELTKAHILTVCSAGNEGPIPNSVGSPATSFVALSVGALDYAPSSRVLYEFLGFASGLGPGMGLVMRPTDEVRVANFSSRGPLSDGRLGPEISALGQWNFGVDPDNSLLWVGGTSFAAPTVSGAAALLNAYLEAKGSETPPLVLENVLLRGADPGIVGGPWRDQNDQGYGALDAVAALDALKNKRWFVAPRYPGRLCANILGSPTRGKTQKWESRSITVNPSEVYNAVLEVSRYTSKVTIEVYDIQTPDNSDYAFWPNALEVHVQSAKRTAADHPVAIYWYPYDPDYGKSFTIEIGDGPWTINGGNWAYQPMEPGLMKVSLLGDYSNESRVRFKLRVKRENNLQPPNRPIAQGTIRSGDNVNIPVTIPANTKSATFDLRWQRDWSVLPTSDLDMVILDENGNPVNFDGATLNAPERAVLTAPPAGTYYVNVDGYEVYRPDFYQLFLNLE